MKLQDHHIHYEEPNSRAYDDDECLNCGHIRRGEWIVTLPWFMHQPLIILQRWKATEERYALIINWIHAIFEEAQRLRRELDQAEE